MLSFVPPSSSDFNLYVVLITVLLILLLGAVIHLHRKCQQLSKERAIIADSIKIDVCKQRIETWEQLEVNEALLHVLDYTLSDWKQMSEEQKKQTQILYHCVGNAAIKQDLLSTKTLLRQFPATKKNGSNVWIRERLTYVSEGNGQWVHCSFCDNFLYRSILDEREINDYGMNVGIIVIEAVAPFRILYNNHALHVMLGYERNIEMPKEFGNMLQQEESEKLQRIIAATNMEHVTFEIELQFYHRQTGEIWLLLKGSCMQGFGDQLHLNCMMMDISKQKSNEEKLLINEACFEIAMQEAKHSLFNYDIKSRILIPPKRFHKLFSLPCDLENMMEPEVIDHYLYPADKSRYIEMFQKIEQGIKTADGEFRIRGITNQYFWYKVTMTTIYDQHHEPTKAVGIMEDITKRKEAEKNYLQEQSFRKVIFSNLMEHYEVNVSQNLIEKGNESLKSENFLEDADDYTKVISHMAVNRVHENDRALFLEAFSLHHLLRMQRRKETIFTLQFRYLNDAEETVWVNGTMHLLLQEHTADLKALFTMQDIDSHKKYELQLQRQAQQDALTGLYNKGVTKELIEAYLQDNPTSQDAFFILDMDSFKNINDRFGHLIGDNALQLYAEMLKRQFRNDDIIGRIGGDEFVVLMKNVNTTHIKQKAQQLIRGCIVTYDNGENLMVTASIGIARRTCIEDTFESLYKQADIAMYRAKAGGKERYEIYCTDEVKSELRSMSCNASINQTI